MILGMRKGMLQALRRGRAEIGSAFCREGLGWFPLSVAQVRSLGRTEIQSGFQLTPIIITLCPYVAP